MYKNSESFSTPLVQTKSKSLGLSRKNSVTKTKLAAAIKITNTTTTPIRTSLRNKEAANSETTPILSQSETTPILPQSDVIARTSGALTPATPTTLSLRRNCVSTTNCRPYSLSLSKRIREKMTKKRLEFHLANEMEKEELELKLSQEWERKDKTKIEASSETAKDSQEIDSSSQLRTLLLNSQNDGQDEKTNGNASILAPEDMSRNQLLSKIEELRKDLNSRQQHERKVQELQQAIDTWKQGFSLALKDLQEKITPQYEHEDLLKHLHIPNEMLKYV